MFPKKSKPGFKEIRHLLQDHPEPIFEVLLVFSTSSPLSDFLQGRIYLSRS
jgi:hypothetical protein